MASRVASIIAEIGIEKEGFESGALDVQSAVTSLIGTLGKIHPAAAIAIAAIGALFGVISKGAEVADESNRIQAKLEAVIKATGSAAGLTADEINKMNDAFMEQTGVDDELLNNASAVLLTFRNIGENVFPDATQAALDMSAVMGGDLQGSIVMVGKALQDPIQGVTALRRVGVQLSEEQERQIKNFMAQNDLAGAQGVILNELQKEFGGAAKAIHEAGNGAEDLKNSIENLYEEIGQRAIPTIRAFNQSQKGWIDAVTLGIQVTEKRAEIEGLMERILASEGLTLEKSTRFKQVDNSATQEQINLAWEQAAAMVNEEEKAEARNEAILEHTSAVNQEAEALQLVKAALSGDFEDTWDNFDESLANLKTEQGELNVKLVEAIGLYGTNSEEANGYREKIDENVAAQRDLKDATDEAVRSMIFQQVAARADAATQLELARAMGLVSEEDYNIAKATEAIVDQGTPDFVDPEEVGQIQALADNILRMKGENIPITFDALISATIVDQGEVGRQIASTVSNSILQNLAQTGQYATLAAMQP